MKLGFAISLTVHVALILWAVLNFQRAKLDDIPDTIAISVAVVTPSDVTRMRQGDETTHTLDSKAPDKPSEDNSQKEAAKPKAAVAPPPPLPPAVEQQPQPTPEPAKTEPPKPDPIEEKLAALPPEKAPDQPPPPVPAPVQDDQAALAAKIEEERKAEAKRKAEAEAKAKADAEKKRKEAEAKKKAEEERKKKLAAAAKAKAEAEKKKFDPNDPDALTKILNGDTGPQKALIDKSNKPSGAKPTGNSQVATNVGPSAGTKEGRDSVLSAREADMLGSMLNSAIKIHWRLPAGGGASDTPVVQVRFRLRPDGSLDGEPQVLAPQNTPQFAVAAESAVRAVKEAAPYTMLPPDKYAAWADNKVEFDPSKMLQ